MIESAVAIISEISTEVQIDASCNKEKTFRTHEEGFLCVLEIIYCVTLGSLYRFNSCKPSDRIAGKIHFYVTSYTGPKWKKNPPLGD